MSDRERGLYGKFRIERTDGKSANGEKHDHCEYFVLDATHDPFALFALENYAVACEVGGYASLAADLRVMIERGRKAQEA